MRQPVDDRTAVYILESQRQFEDLKQVAAQLAGVLVLAAAGANTASPDHPLIRTAAELHGAVFDALHTAHVSDRAREHHAFLVQAAQELRTALAAARTDVAVEPVLRPLQRAYTHLQNASRALPGFEMVAFDRGCCAIKTRMAS